MIEIIVLWRLCKRIGDIVREKGHRRWPWILLTVLLWFGGEATMALVLAGTWGLNAEQALAPIYFLALLGAAAGAGTSYVVANTLAPVTRPSSEDAPDSEVEEGLGPAAAAPATIKPLLGLTQWLKVLLKANIAITILTIFINLYSFTEYINLDPEIDANAVWLPSDNLGSFVGFIALLLAAVTAISILRWIYRANKNLRALTGQMTYSPGWAVGWYFVPIAQLWMPYRVMREIWIVSHCGAPAEYQTLRWWWFLWIVARWLWAWGSEFASSPSDARGYAASSLLGCLGCGLEIALCLVTLGLVSSVAAAYTRNYVAAAIEAIPREPLLEAGAMGTGMALP